jgi:hypothetical protein
MTSPARPEPLSAEELAELRGILSEGEWPARYGSYARPQLARRLLATIEHRVEQERAACAEEVARLAEAYAAMAEAASDEPVLSRAESFRGCATVCSHAAGDIRARGAHRKEPE